MSLEDSSGIVEAKTYQQPEWISKGARLKDMKTYKEMHDRSLKDPDAFWTEMATRKVSWFRPFTQVQSGSFVEGDVAWFLNGQLNVSYNCLDRHIPTRGDKVAILWEGDDPREIRRITYREALQETCRFANVLKRMGVRKGDCVALYMPMVPEAAYAMLACARIGAPHSVIFAGFSAESLKDRILDGKCRYVITADQGMRGNKTIPLKDTVDEALQGCPDVSHVLVYRRTGAGVNMVAGRDYYWHQEMAKERPYCPPEPMDSEDTLFLLYTSGSTGKPKGILHTTAGYLVWTAMTHEYAFDLKENDVYACVADVGWITGHSYIVYGPLCNGSTTFMFESTPTYPDAGRYWEMVQRHKISILYTAPTAIRALMVFGDDFVKPFDRSSLRVLGSVGEPINPEAWLWYHEVVGDGKRSIVDTYWQTETGGFMLTPLAGTTPLKPGSATFPMFGVEPKLLDKDKGTELKGNAVRGVLVMARPWPGMARTVAGDHQRYLKVYMKPYPGYYFTGDGCVRDQDGFYWVTGRVDDVINVSGHRLGSAEIESALVGHDGVSEAAVIGVPHPVKGQSLFAYVTVKLDVKEGPDLMAQLRATVRKYVGGFAIPDDIVVTRGLPKTRSGKIMRRLLRKLAEGEYHNLGDVSTLADPAVVEELIVKVKALQAAKKK
eukprot:g39238.t1